MRNSRSPWTWDIIVLVVAHQAGNDVSLMVHSALPRIFLPDLKPSHCFKTPAWPCEISLDARIRSVRFPTFRIPSLASLSAPIGTLGRSEFCQRSSEISLFGSIIEVKGVMHEPKPRGRLREDRAHRPRLLCYPVTGRWCM